MDIDFSFKNKRKPKIGRVLLSDPFSKDAYFSRSVVYLCEHNKDGTLGFVLTNYLDINLVEVADNFPQIGSRVSLGGPVKDDNIFFIHTLGDKIPNSIAINDGIFLGGDYEKVKALIQENKIKETEVRFFLGYSGWTPGQLEEEIEYSSWIVAPVLNPLEIMDTSIEDIWQKFMKREGKKYDVLSKSPIDFNDN